MDYKSTLNIPKTDFEMRGNLNAKEPKIQQEWKEKSIYKKVLNKNNGKPLFLLHDGPPYANGNIHIGHALNKTLKDIIVRQKNLMGYYAPFIPGWDTHGLPIELAMIKKYGVQENESKITRRQHCKDYANEQVEIQKKQFLRIGMLSDFEKIYRTMDHEFEINQLNLFLTCIERDLIFRDKKPVYWSWSSQSALAEAEIEYKDAIDTSIYVAFDLTKNLIGNTPSKLVIWTTTPWTIPSNLAVAVNPRFEYVICEFNNEHYIIGRDCLQQVCEELNWNDVKVIKVLKGDELENLTYKHPLYNKEGKIILADYITNDGGTCLVHNAPGFGQEDYLACAKYNILPFAPIDKLGKFTVEVNDPELIGLFYQDANDIIIQRLEKNKNLLKQKKITHRVACDWRTKKPVIYLATDQWFVNLEKINHEILQTLDNDVSSPFVQNINRMREMINNRVEWCISRQRIWGVPIPIIYDDQNKPIMDKELIKNIIDVLDKNGTDVWFEWDVNKFLTSKYLHTNKTFTKEQDIMDVWFDSGTSHQLFKNVWNLDYPADIYLEGSDQYRGWFNSSLITGTIQNNKAPYKTLIQHGFTLDENGIKMSKSIGNVVDPLKIFDVYGADIFRLWVSSCEYSDDQRFGENIIKQISELYRRLRNTLFKYSLSIINGFNEKDWQTDLAKEDEYIIFELSKTLNEIDTLYKNYNFSNIVKLINNFTIKLSSWYFDLIKDEMYCGSLKSKRQLQIQTTVYTILFNLLIAIAPILVHTSEETYSFLPFKKYESIHLEEWINLDLKTKLTQNEINSFINFFGEVKDKVYYEIENMRNAGLIKKSNMCKVVLKQNPTSFDNETLKQYLNVAEVLIDSNLVSDVQITVSDNKMCQRCWNYYDPAHMHNDEICLRCDEVINNTK